MDASLRQTQEQTQEAVILPNFAQTLKPEYAPLWELTYLPTTTNTGFLSRIDLYQGYIAKTNAQDIEKLAMTPAPQKELALYADQMYWKTRGYLLPYVHLVNEKHWDAYSTYTEPADMLASLQDDHQYKLARAMIDAFNLKAKRINEFAFALAVTKQDLVKEGLWTINQCRLEFFLECLRSSVEMQHSNHPSAELMHHRALNALEVIVAQTKCLLTGVLSGGWAYEQRPGFLCGEPVLTSTVQELYPDRFEFMHSESQTEEAWH
jgi:hypothetical protein